VLTKSRGESKHINLKKGRKRCRNMNTIHIQTGNLRGKGTGQMGGGTADVPGEEGGISLTAEGGGRKCVKIKLLGKNRQPAKSMRAGSKAEGGGKEDGKWQGTAGNYRVDGGAKRGGRGGKGGERKERISSANQEARNMNEIYWGRDHYGGTNDLPKRSAHDQVQEGVEAWGARNTK